MRHHLVVNLQPIGMIYEVMERRLRAPAPDLTHVHDSAGKINSFAKAALTACIDVVGWLAPDEAAGTTAEETARECSSLLATSLSFRGYALRTTLDAVPRPVRRAALRHLLSAGILHCTDQHPAPAELLLAATAESEGVRIDLTVRAVQGEPPMVTEPNYRKITWADLEALAEADGVQVARTPEGVTLRLPWHG